MALKEIGTTVKTVTVRQYVGGEAVMVVDADGLVVEQHKEGKMRQVVCPESFRLVVGSDAEIDAEKIKADEKYAPIKAADTQKV